MASYRCLDTNCNGRGILKYNHKITNKDNQDLEFYNFKFLEKKYNRFQIKAFFIKKYGEIKLIMNYYLTKKLII